MTDMADSGTGSKLFVRQSSGLVRDVSVTNALFFNVAAFVGVGLTLYPIFYSLGFIPVWTWGPFSEYGWAAIVTGIFCVLLAIIFASLTSVMPRSGGDYVFTSRITHPFLGWLEAWTLVIASVLIIAFEVPLVLRNLQITARIIGIGAGGSFFQDANTWFTDSTGGITGTPGFIGSLVVLAIIAGVVLLPTRTFHRVVTALAIFGVAAFVAMFVFGLLATSRADFNHNLPQYTGGVTAAKIAASGHPTFLPGESQDILGDLFSHTIFPIMLSILLFQYIGFQYSAYIAGEVRGNVRRGVLVALLGALLIGVIANSVYVDTISKHLGFDMNVSWGASYWGFNANLPVLPMGQPNAMPLLGVIANSSLWPIWALISFAGAIFPFLLCPVYINFISRMQPRPPAPGVVRRGERADARAAERDFGNARADRALPLLPELQRPPPLPRHDGQQAQPGGHGVVLDHDGDPHVDDAGRERAPRARAAAGPDPKRPVREGAPVGGPGLARVPGVGVRVRDHQADLGQPHGDRRLEADLPRDERHPRRADLLRNRHRHLLRDADAIEGGGRRHEHALR